MFKGKGENDVEVVAADSSGSPQRRIVVFSA